MSAPEFSAVSLAKLTSAGLDEEYARGKGIQPVATLADLPDELRGSHFAQATPGMVFWHTRVDGTRVPQYRPDVPVIGKDGPVKYVFPGGSYVGFGVIRPRDESTHTALIVEGTLQALAAARYAPKNTAVYFVPGCYGWSEDQMASPDLGVVAGLAVVAVFDADIAKKRDVYNAAAKLGEALTGWVGVESMRYARIPGSGTNGIDDVLGRLDEKDRAARLEVLIAEAKARPADVKPKEQSRKLSRMSELGLIEPNDTALGTTWADEHRDAFRMRVADNGAGDRWLAYRLGRWAPASEKKAYDSVARFLDTVAAQYGDRADEEKGDIGAQLADTARQLLSEAKIRSVLNRAAGHSDLHVDAESLDDPDRVGFWWCAANGLINLKTGEFGPHNPELMITVGSDVAYDPAATCPRFDAFLAEVLPDPEVRAFVLRLFGVAMLGYVPGDAHVFPVFIGEGRNGKGTLIRIMTRLFGKLAVKVSAAALQERKFEEHTQEIVKLKGKRLATAEEPSRGRAWSIERINGWTGGDRLVGRLMKENDTEFDPSHLLIVTMNHRPPVPPGEAAFWMRYREVPFNVSVRGREDKTLEPHIFEHELPGVLNRVLAALAEYHRDGLAAPEAVLVATEEAEAQAEPLTRFGRSGVITVTGDPNDVMAVEEVNRLADAWMRDEGVAPDVIQRLERDGGRVQMLAAGFGEGAIRPTGNKKTINGKRDRFWAGVKIGAPEDQPTGSPLRKSLRPLTAEEVEATIAKIDQLDTAPESDCAQCRTIQRLGGVGCGLHFPEFRTQPGDGPR